MNETEIQVRHNAIPSVSVAIIGSAEAGLPALIKSEGLANTLGAVSVAAILSMRDAAPLVLESKRLDIFYDARANERDHIEGIPSELQPGRTHALKGIDDPTSISSRMAHRPSTIRHAPAGMNVDTN
jgi:hypothetical protein